MKIIKKPYLTKIPHEGGELSFQYLAFKGTYGNIANKIDKAGLKRPTSQKTASLIYEAWKNPKGKKESKIIKILENNLIYEFTGNFFLSESNEEINNGVILDLDSQNFKFANGKLVMNKDNLIKRLQNNDPLVKFVPFEYKTGEQNLIEFLKNPYVVARYGEEGAEKIAEVASKYKNKPYVWGFDPCDEEKVTMSALHMGWAYGNTLGVVRNDACKGCTFGEVA